MEMKRLLLLLVIGLLVACGGGNTNVEPDYTTEEFEEALNDGEDLTGKTVSVTIDNVEPSSAFGHNLQAGEHLNFVSNKNPKLEKGDSFIAEVEEVENVMGSFIITYKKK